MTFDGNQINALIPCGFRGCDNALFALDETSSPLGCIDVICFNCRYKRQLSMEKYQSIIDIKDFKQWAYTKYGCGWDDKFLREKKERKS